MTHIKNYMTHILYHSYKKLYRKTSKRRKIGNILK